MYTLYYYPGNANLAPHMLLEELGVPYELVLVDREQNAHKQADYLKLNPTGRIPVLIDRDLVLFETAAICLHLVDRHPEAGLAPAVGTAERAEFYK
ncbi:MAG TPA: glutathione S-transferase N-terminal domain-containing protein [Noviherbaspirillum sp.]